MKKILLTILAVLAMSGMAVAQTETLLTTITPTAKEQASYSTANVATVSFSYTADGSSAYLANWGWWGYGFTATVTAAEGYTITKCIFYDDANRTATDSEAPFVVETTEEDKTPRINGTPIDGGNMWSKGIKMIEVYGYVTPTAPSDINLHRNDDGSWSFIMPGRNLVMSTETFSTNDTVNGHYLAGVPEGWLILALGDTVPVSNDLQRRTTPITEGTPVTIVPTGNLRRIKSITLVDELPPVVPLDNTTTAWTAGTFTVPAGGLTYSDAITVSGNVTLVLTDGETLTLNKGISLADGATLTIQGNGTMNVNGTNNSTASTVAGSTGTLILTSGTLTATGGNGGSIGSFGLDNHGGNGGVAINGSVIISGGTLTARGGNGGSVGNDGYECSGGNGGDAISGTLTINSGTVTSTNGANGQLGQDTDDCSAGAGGKAVAGAVTDNR